MTKFISIFFGIIFGVAVSLSLIASGNDSLKTVFIHEANNQVEYQSKVQQP